MSSSDAFDQRILDVLVHRRFLGGDKARSHVHAGGAHRQRRDQAARVRHAAGGNERYFQFLGRARQQDHVGHVVFAGMAAAFEAVDADGVAADLLGLQRVPNRSAFVDHLDASRLQGRHVLLGATPCGFDDLDAAFPDGCDVFRIGRRAEGRQKGQIHAEWLIRHFVAARDLLCQQFRRSLRQSGDDPEPASIRHGGREFGKAHIVHSALDDRMFDAEQSQ